MPLVLSNDDVSAVLTMKETVAALEQLYADMVTGDALNRPRTHSHLATQDPETFYRFKSMEGGSPGMGVYAIRMCSELVQFPVRLGHRRQEKLQVDGKYWVGLIMVFSADEARLLAIMPDGVVSRMRVGATSAIGAKYLSREDSRVVGLFGSGWQAGAQVMAFPAVRPIRQVRVYSPRVENRTRFAQEMAKATGIEVVSVDSPEETIRGADIVASATNALAPIIRGQLLEPGMHVTAMQAHEWDDDVYRRCNVIINHVDHGDDDYVPGTMDPTKVVVHLNDRQMPDGRWLREAPSLIDLMRGAVPGRTAAGQITGFYNQIGLGGQFAAVAGRAFALARAKGLGHDLPGEWFMQDVHS